MRTTKGDTRTKTAGRTATLIALFVLLSSCSIEETLRHPSCSQGDSSLIAAQSVSAAVLVPCFDELPAGWEVEYVEINQDGTTIEIDSDRAGDSAARLRFVEACDVGEAVATPSDYDRAERFELIREITPRFIADRYYQFEGGCLWWHFDFDIGVPSAMSVELGNSLRLLDRTAVNDDLRESFVDEDL